MDVLSYCICYNHLLYGNKLSLIQHQRLKSIKVFISVEVFKLASLAGIFLIQKSVIKIIILMFNALLLVCTIFLLRIFVQVTILLANLCY